MAMNNYGRYVLGRIEICMTDARQEDGMRFVIFGSYKQLMEGWMFCNDILVMIRLTDVFNKLDAVP